MMACGKKENSSMGVATILMERYTKASGLTASPKDLD
jgi:hypothetical protein